MALVNIMESIANDRLEILLTGYDCCKCDACRMDMLALALNEVKPKYANTRKGELIQKINVMRQQNTVDLDVALIRAIHIVISNPRHDNVEPAAEAVPLSVTQEQAMEQESAALAEDASQEEKQTETPKKRAAKKSSGSAASPKVSAKKEEEKGGSET